MPSSPKGNRTWLWLLLLLLLLLLWLWWKRQPKKEVPVAWTPPTDDASGGASTGASYYTQYANTSPDALSTETINYLNTLRYSSPTFGPTQMPLYQEYLLIRDNTAPNARASNPAYGDVVAQIKDAIRAHYPNALV